MRYILPLLLAFFVILTACSAPEPMPDAAPLPAEDPEPAPAEDTVPEPDPEPVPEEETADADNPGLESDVKTFVLTGENFAFFSEGEENPEIRVNVGDTVRIEFSSTQGFHDWVVDEFGAATDKVREDDGMTSVEFVADQTGTFEYYCSVGSHRANGMWGNLVVE